MRLDTLRPDSRGVSEVIGSILVFGLVVALVSMLQVQAVPNANQAVEFEHSNQLSNDMADLQVAMSESVDTGRTKEATVKLGAEYPPRLLLFNPPPANGRLHTSDTATIRISNAEADGNLGNYLATDPQLETRTLNYTVRYNELENSPEHVVEAGVYYEAFDDEVLVQDATLVDGREISLVAVGGELSASGVQAETVAAEPLSAPARTYTVSHTGGPPITIEIPTTLPKEQWSEILDGEYATDANDLDGDTVSGSGYVKAASYDSSTDPNTLTITLKRNEEYTLRLGKVGFGTGGDPSPRYIVPVADDDPTVATIEVRDGFNNPVSGVEVDVQGTSETVTTGPDGRASYRPSSGQTVTFQRDFDDSGSATAPLEKVTVAITGPRDPTDPAIDSSTVESDVTETCDGLSTISGGTLPSGALVCSGTFRTLTQPIVAFTVSDDATAAESGIDHVDLRVLDPDGDVITTKTVDGNGRPSVTSRWVGPWLDDGGASGRMTPDAVEIVVVDRSGRSVTRTESL